MEIFSAKNGKSFQLEKFPDSIIQQGMQIFPAENGKFSSLQKFTGLIMQLWMGVFPAENGNIFEQEMAALENIQIFVSLLSRTY